MERPRQLRSPPQTQARSSNTFTPPPLDGSLTLAEIYDWHFHNTPNHRVFVYARQDGTIRTIYWPEVVQAVHVGARMLRSRFGWVPGIDDLPVVAILASSDMIPYSILLMSCLRANYVVFPISPRNSPSAIAHLMEKVGVDHLMIGHEPAMLQLANESLRALKEESPLRAVPDISSVPRFEDLFLPDSGRSAVLEDLPYEYKGPDATICIIHSSGSTAFPKPIYLTNHRAIQAALMPYFGERDLTDQVFSLHGLPMYHGMGIIQAWWSASCGLVVSAFEPSQTPPIPTPSSLLHAARATSSDIIFFFKAWSREPEHVKWLASRGGVLYGGGPLNKDIGDYLTAQGVSIFIFYGSSEGGLMSTVLPAQTGYDWNYFRFPGFVTAEMVPQCDNVFELVMVVNHFGTPAVLNTQVGGIDAYATSDLLVPHPTKPGYWRVFGRADDQIMHSTGEKTNPGPLENILNQDPHVSSCVMFGRERLQAGIIVDPKPALRFDPSNLVKLAEFRNSIWPTVEKMNHFAPQHSRLFKEMIIISKPNKPLTYTAKMTPRRQAVINDYEDDITVLYETVEQTSALNIAPLLEWDAKSILIFVRDAIHSVMTARIGDDEDIFQHGCDSLQATWIRNSLLRPLRQSAQIDTRKYAGNFVYEYPTISSLGQFIFTIASKHGEASLPSETAAMHAMVATYSQDFPNHTGRYEVPPTTAKVVLVTGTTGELGCYILSLLLADPSVVQVYALNRSSLQNLELRKRQGFALRDRGLDSDILDSPKLSLLEGNLLQPMFGLTHTVFDQLQQSVTRIMHTAWPVDFNLALPSFQPNIEGLRKLIDFSLGSPFVEPPTVIYTSSIGVLQNAKCEEALKEAMVDAETAAGSGYQESKWVAEQILLKAATSTPLKPLIVRVGQLCGGINGAWNTDEWLPALVQSAKILQCIPDDSRDVSWLAAHTAAAALVDFLDADGSAQIIHLVNPQPVAWSTLATTVAADLGVPLTHYSDWLSQLEDAVPMHEHHKEFRATRMLQFFQLADRRIDGADAFGFPRLDMTNALRLSETLRLQTCRLGEEDVRKWMSYWEGAGLLYL
ncbi:hypothetical protein C8R43DRAFT_1207614 [Mycena crocata]|nr:hypothetical protein C8R43DRAFT_1207614 [Mycena crocata]